MAVQLAWEGTVALGECPECGAPLSSSARACPHCGSECTQWVDQATLRAILDGAIAEALRGRSGRYGYVSDQEALVLVRRPLAGSVFNMVTLGLWRFVQPAFRVYRLTVDHQGVLRVGEERQGAYSEVSFM